MRSFTFVALALIAALVVPAAGGCVVVPRHGHHRGAGPAHQRRCHPSQYWDGYQCRHKGRGGGARKHDGRR